MDELKNSVRASMSPISEGDAVINKKVEKTSDEKHQIPKKNRVGRPSKQNKETKLNAILKNRNMTRKDLYLLIAKKYPD